MTRAVFLDRDGVLIEDVHLLTQPAQLRVLSGVPEALQRLATAGFKLFVVSNQPVVARGLATEVEVECVHTELQRLITTAGGARVEQFYFCPHHPNATLPAYRVACDCRKPRPGMFQQAAREHDLALGASFMVGDRITDIIAGARAGCRTALVQTGRHEDAPIESPDGIDAAVQPDFTGENLVAAAEWILAQAAIK